MLSKQLISTTANCFSEFSPCIFVVEDGTISSKQRCLLFFKKSGCVLRSMLRWLNESKLATERNRIPVSAGGSSHKLSRDRLRLVMIRLHMSMTSSLKSFTRWYSTPITSIFEIRGRTAKLSLLHSLLPREELVLLFYSRRRPKIAKKVTMSFCPTMITKPALRLRYLVTKSRTSPHIT